MSRPFDPQSKSFGTLLGQYETHQIIVPEFQRGYSWEKEHVSDFWTDINDFRHDKSGSSSKKYFIGPIVVLPDGETLQLLDGQQRLATATVLFSVIRDAANAIGSKEALYLARDVQRDLIAKDTDNKKFSLVLGETDRDFFRRVIQKETPDALKPTIRSHRLITTARKFLEGAVRDELTGKKPAEQVKVLEQIKRTVASDVTMVSIEVSSEDDAYRIFETLNDRGFKLTVPDLVLNFLMRFAPGTSERREIRENWTEMIEMLGQKDIDRFLRHMWVSQFGDVKKEGLFVKVKAYVKNNSVDTLEFAKACASECANYMQLMSGDEEALGKKACATVEAILRKMAVDNAMPVLLSAHRCLDRTAFSRVAKLTASIIVRHKILSNKNPGTLETTFYKTAKTIRELKDAGKTPAFIVNSVKEAYSKINPSNPDILNNSGDVYVTKGEAQYILTSIENKLHSPTKEHAVDEVNLEHIFPENPSDEWKNTEDLVGMEWHLGNLTILGENINRKAANKGYAAKLKSHYVKSKVELTKHLAATYAKWEATDILARSTELVTEAVEIWKIPK